MQFSPHFLSQAQVVHRDRADQAAVERVVVHRAQQAAKAQDLAPPPAHEEEAVAVPAVARAALALQHRFFESTASYYAVLVEPSQWPVSIHGTERWT